MNRYWSNFAHKHHLFTLQTRHGLCCGGPPYRGFEGHTLKFCTMRESLGTRLGKYPSNESGWKTLPEIVGLIYLHSSQTVIGWLLVCVSFSPLAITVFLCLNTHIRLATEQHSVMEIIIIYIPRYCKQINVVHAL